MRELRLVLSAWKRGSTDLEHVLRMMQACPTEILQKSCRNIAEILALPWLFLSLCTLQKYMAFPSVDQYPYVVNISHSNVEHHCHTVSCLKFPPTRSWLDARVSAFHILLLDFLGHSHGK